MKMLNQSKFEEIAAQNQELIKKIIDLGNALKCRNQVNNTFVKDLLEITRTKKDHLLILNNSIIEHQNYLKELQNQMSVSDNCNINEQGKNTGGHVNHEEEHIIKRHEQMDELKQIIEAKIMKRNAIAIAIENSYELLTSFIDLLPQKDYAEILKLFYLERLDYTDIMKRYDYWSYNKIQMAVLRGKDYLGAIIDKFYL